MNSLIIGKKRTLIIWNDLGKYSLTLIHGIWNGEKKNFTVNFVSDGSIHFQRTRFYIFLNIVNQINII